MRRLFALQGAYYFVTGIWPLVHMESFLAVTGPKTDLWLVRTVGALLAVTGFALFRERRAFEPSRNLALLALGQAAALALVDAYYVAKGVLPRIYLADGAPELLLAVLWVRQLFGWRHAP